MLAPVNRQGELPSAQHQTPHQVAQIDYTMPRIDVKLSPTTKIRGEPFPHQRSRYNADSSRDSLVIVWRSSSVG